MVVAASLALMTVSTVVAFQGWPGISNAQTTGQAGTLLAIDAGEHAAQRTKRAALVVPKRQTPTRVVKRAATAPRKVTRVTTPVRTASPTAAKTPSRPAATPQQAPKTASVDQKPPAAKRQPSAGDPVRRVGAGLGGTVSTAGEKLGEAVGNASPPLGQLVTNVTDVVANVVANATELLGKVLDGLTGAPRTP